MFFLPMKRALESSALARDAVLQCVDQTLGHDDPDHPVSIVRLFRLQRDLQKVCADLLPAAGLLACLPAELLFMVLNHCSVKDWSALARTCRHLLQLVTQRAQDYCGRFGFLSQKTNLPFLATFLYHSRRKLQKDTKISKRSFSNERPAKFRWDQVYMATSPVLVMTPDCLIRKITRWIGAYNFFTALNITPEIACSSGLLFWATWTGYMPVLWFLVRDVGVTAQDFLVKAHETTAFELGVASRRLETVRFLFETVGLTVEDARAEKVWAQATSQGLGAHARNILELHYKFRRGSLGWAHHSCMDVLTYLFETVGLTLDDARTDQLWHQALSCNREAILYLINKVGLTAQDLQSALHLITPGSPLIGDFFGKGLITVDDIRADNNRLLRGYAHDWHHLMYLFGVVGLTAEDARANDNEALWNAARFGGPLFQSVAYFFESVKLTVDDFRAVNNRILRDCLPRDDNDVLVKYLFKRVRLTANDARANGNEALRMAARNGNLSRVKYLLEKHLTVGDIRSIDMAALREWLPRDHPVLNYLETFTR